MIEAWLPGQPWKRATPVAETDQGKPGGRYCGHRYAEPGCTGCGYEFPQRGGPVADVDQEKVVQLPVEHDPECRDDRERCFAVQCICTCHEKPLTQAELRSARSRAQTRAKTQLSHEFKWRYRELYYLELAKEGLTVVNDHRLGVATRRVLQRERGVRDG